MKHALLTLALAVSASAAMAQNAEPTVLKPTTGAKNLELLLNPFTSDPVRLVDGIKFRYFTSPTTALRALVNLSYNQSTNVKQDDPELHVRSNRFNIMLRPGIEQHLEGTRRLSPYFGGELALGLTLTGEKEEFDDNGSVVEQKKSNGSGFLFAGINGLAGTDIYLAQNFYLGLELGFGIGYKQALQSTITDSEGNETKTMVATEGDDKTSRFDISPFVTSGIRVGWIF